MRKAAQKRLARVLGGPDAPGAQQALRGGAVVTAVDKTSTPWSVTLLLADGGTATGVKCVGWYNPRVNDVVLVGVAGNALVCLGGYAGDVQVVATTASLTTPTNGATAAAPAAPPTYRTEYVSPNSGRTWAPHLGSWRFDTDLKQGGPSAQRAFWFYGSKIAAAKGSGTITAATIYVRRSPDGGVYGKANVRLGMHPNGTQPGSGSTGLSNVRVATTLGLNEAKTIPLSAAQIGQLNSGTMLGVGLEPGSLGVESADYLPVWPVGSKYASGQLALTIAS